MKKELQDRVWSVLPKEFKEGVKKIYRKEDSYIDGVPMVIMLEDIFGFENLTSDEDGEEMLTVSAKRVRQNYSEKLNEKGRHTATKHDKDMATGWCNALRFLFGSKCLPDETQSKQKDCDNPLADKEGCRWRNDYGKCALSNGCYFEPLESEEPNPSDPKQSAPKFKVGCKVISKDGYIGVVDCIQEEITRVVRQKEDSRWFAHGDLEPYTEPETSHGKSNISQYTANCDISRLQIAAMAMQGLIARTDATAYIISKTAFEYTDSLLREWNRRKHAE